MPRRTEARLKQALDQVLQELRAAPDVQGVLFHGSAARGVAGPHSDVDLFVVGGRPGLRIRPVAGVPVEQVTRGAAEWRAFLEQRQPLAVLAWAGGRVLLDRDGAAAALQELARRLEAEGPAPLAAGEVAAWRFRLTKLLLDLRDLTDRPPEFGHVGGLLMAQVLEAHRLLGRQWGAGPRRALRELATRDPALAAQVRTWYTAPAPAERLAAAEAAVLRVLKPHGGLLTEWEG